MAHVFVKKKKNVFITHCFISIVFTLSLGFFMNLFINFVLFFTMKSSSAGVEGDLYDFTIFF